MFWDEEIPLPTGWIWLPIPGGPGPYRVLWERLVPGSGTCFRPAWKQ